jgi:hypothetical protein
MRIHEDTPNLVPVSLASKYHRKVSQARQKKSPSARLFSFNAYTIGLQNTIGFQNKFATVRDEENAETNLPFIMTLLYTRH